MKTDNSKSDVIKAIELRKHKTLATGLFVLMVIIYIACTWAIQSYPAAWLGYVRAFAEAGMVGALADWFAVTALFHHPMGIPIPHTNLIKSSKARIGDNLGGFVVTNFLNAETIRPYIEKLHISSFVAGWLSKDSNVNMLVTEISRMLNDIIKKMDDKAVVKFITHKSKDLLKDVNLNEALAGIIKIIMQRGDHERILDLIVLKLKEYIITHEDEIRKKVKEESYFLVPGFVDNIIASKLTKGAVRYLDEISLDTDHKVRIDLNEQLLSFVSDLHTKPEWKNNISELKDTLISGEKIQQYASSVWKSLQQSILEDLSAERSAVKLYIKKTIREMVAGLKNDDAMRQKIDGWIRFNAYKYALRNAREAGRVISNTVGNWEGAELSDKLELEVGKDLQYIRINGTLVGGLVGLLIYTITHLVT